MSLKLVTAVSAAFALALVACAASSEDAASDSAASTTDDHAKHIGDIAAKQYGDQVDGVFGVFARGESALYRGTFAAHDNQGVVEGGGDAVIASQPAVAALQVVDGNLTLRVESAAQRHVDFVQSSTGTMVSMIMFDTETGGMLSQCKDCIPSFSTKPAALKFDNVEVDGHFFDDAATPFAITATADLAKVPVSGITYSDLESTQAAYGFAASPKGDLVRHVEDIVDEALPTKPGMYSCWLRTNYELDQYVDPTDITKYGTRDFKVDAVSTCCLSPGVCAGGGLCVPPSQSKSFTSGVGASVTATTNTEITSASGAVLRTLTVAYSDKGAYFGGDKDFKAVAIVHRQGMNGDMPITLKFDLTGGKGSATLPDAAIITKVEFAFSNTAGTRWDSNESKNYAISF